MKKIINFRFNKQQYADLADYLHKIIIDTPFNGHVFLVGNVITHQVLKLNRKSEYLNIVVDLPNGGLTFPIWTTYRHKCYKEGVNPLIDTDRYHSIFSFGDDSPLKDKFFMCQQTRNSFFHNEKRSHDKWYGTLEQDAAKRGLTLESLYYNVADGCLYDPTEKAFDDLESKTIRATDVKDVFIENPLKMLTAILYASEYGFGIEKDTWFSIVEHAKNLKDVNPISLRVELDKIITSEKPSTSIRRMFNSGLIDYTWPFINDMVKLKTMPYDHVNETLFDHTMKVVDGVPAFLVTRLGALFHDIGKIKTSDKMYVFHQLVGVEMAEDILKQMGYSRVTIDGVATIIRNHEELSKFRGSAAPGTKFARKFAIKCGQHLGATLDVIDANNKAQVFGKKVKQVLNLRAAYKKIAEEEEERKLKELKKVKLPINGNDIKKEFKLKTGIKIGQLLSIVKDEFGRNKNLTKDDCLSICEKALSRGL